MELKAARCPSCQGDLDIPEGKKIIECPYCGTDVIIVQDSKQISTTSITNILSLAETEYKVGNYAIASRQYDRILEIDPANPDAWFGKGLIASVNLFKDSKMSIRMKEYFNKAIECSKSEKKELLQDKIDNFVISAVDQLVESGWSYLNADVASKLYYYLTEGLLNINERKPNQENVIELIINSNALILTYLLNNKKSTFFLNFSYSNPFKAGASTLKNNIDNYTQKLFEINPEKANVINNKNIELIKKYTDNPTPTSETNPTVNKNRKILIILFLVFAIPVSIPVIISTLKFFKGNSIKKKADVTIVIDKHIFCSQEKFCKISVSPGGGIIYGEGVFMDRFYPERVNIGNFMKKDIEIEYKDKNGNSASVSITVYNNPIVDFTWQNNFENDSIYVILFTNKSSNSNSYLWDFGDGTTSVEVNPIHEFNIKKLGKTFTIVLQAKNEYCSDKKSMTLIFP